MDAGRLGPVALTLEVAGAFLAARRAEGYIMWLSPMALAPLLGFLRRLGVVPPPAPAPVTPAEALLGRYRRYLVTERGLAAVTARGYADMVRPFLAEREEAGGLALADLTAAEVTAFVLAACPGKPKGTAKLTVTALRSLLGFPARRGPDQRAAWAVCSGGGQLAAGRASAGAGARASRGAAGQLRPGHGGWPP